MLSMERSKTNDERSLSKLFLYFSDEISDIIWVQAFQLLLQMFRTPLIDKIMFPDNKIDELVDIFIDAIPSFLKSRFQQLRLSEH